MVSRDLKRSADATQFTQFTNRSPQCSQTVTPLYAYSGKSGFDSCVSSREWCRRHAPSLLDDPSRPRRDISCPISPVPTAPGVLIRGLTCPDPTYRLTEQTASPSKPTVPTIERVKKQVTRPTGFDRVLRLIESNRDWTGKESLQLG